MSEQKQRAIVIGSGFGGLGIAAMLARQGYEVHVYEKNESLGGRASMFEAQGFRFDMGPSWYLMPDVFAHFFSLLGERVEDHLDLVRLSPSYRVFYKDLGRTVDIHSDLEKDAKTFESFESGAGSRLAEYLHQAKRKYEIAMGEFVYKNYDSLFDFLQWRMLIDGWKLSIFSTMDRYVARFFGNSDVAKMLQHTLLFLGNSPKNAPALYSLLSYVDFVQGVFYPKGGIHELVKAIVRVGEKHGVHFHTLEPVTEILITDGAATGVRLSSGALVHADLVISNADIQHTETKLLPPEARERSDRYWDNCVMAPSAFLLYLGTNKKFPMITHHNLLFSKDWDQNFRDIFDVPRLPSDPSFYVCAPSVTDATVAPHGCENLFVLVPIAAGLGSTPEELDAYEEKVLATMEREMGMDDLKASIIYKRRFGVTDFADRYNSYRGSGLGLSHTMFQTAFFRPNTYSKKVKNLYFVGAGTNPGIGMPMCLISAELVYKRIVHDASSRRLSSL